MNGICIGSGAARIDCLFVSNEADHGEQQSMMVQETGHGSTH